MISTFVGSQLNDSGRTSLDKQDEMFTPRQHEIHFGDFCLSLEHREIVCAGRRVRLKNVPFQLLMLLSQRAQQIISRKEIFKAVWGIDFDTGTKRIEVQLHYLRRILHDVNSTVSIQTHRGVGLRLHQDL